MNLALSWSELQVKLSFRSVLYYFSTIFKKHEPIFTSALVILRPYISALLIRSS